MPNPFESGIGSTLWIASIRKVAPKLHEKRSQVVLVKLLPPDDAPDLPGFALQYFPEAISDTKQVNYVQKAIPGGNLPLYQWINGGERTISFTAAFSSDVDLSLHDGRTYEALKGQELLDRNVNVAAAILWLRSFMMPTYDEKTARPLPPPRASLSIPGSAIGYTGGVNKWDDSPHKIRCVMTQCDVEYKAFFPSGTPRLASVSLSFGQIAQYPGAVVFPGNVEPGTAPGYSQQVSRGGLSSVIAGGIDFEPGYTVKPRKA